MLRFEEWSFHGCEGLLTREFLVTPELRSTGQVCEENASSWGMRLQTPAP